MTNFNAARQFIKMKREHAQESLSGPGSHLENTTEIISFINSTLINYNITSILDLGCGDWNWFKKVDLRNCSYEGWDCDDVMIDNNKKFGHSFFVKDIITDEYPDVDLIICRDVLFHFPKDMGSAVLQKIKRSSKYFLSTTFKDVTENSEIDNYANIPGWGYYKINLDIEPFNCKDYEIETVYEPKFQRNVSLYKW